MAAMLDHRKFEGRVRDGQHADLLATTFPLDAWELHDVMHTKGLLMPLCRHAKLPRKSICAVDSHTAGEPTRLIVPPVHIPGTTISEKRDYFQRHYDSLRRLLLSEPRGHRDMFGAVITSSTRPDADLGVFFLDNGGYLNMCIHGCIGVATTFLELCPSARHPSPVVMLDTPAGLVQATAHRTGRRIRSVAVRNVPCFVLKENVSIEVGGVGAVGTDIVFGGNLFALVESTRIGFSLDQHNLGKLVSLGLRIRQAAREQVQVRHPLLGHIRNIDLVEFWQPPRTRRGPVRSVVVFGNGQIDRSPCGTGTCAYMALAHHQGLLRLGQRHLHQGILGTLFAGTIIGQTQAGPYPAIIPEISGSAHLTGFHQFVVAYGDPLSKGFLLE